MYRKTDVLIMMFSFHVILSCDSIAHIQEFNHHSQFIVRKNYSNDSCFNPTHINAYHDTLMSIEAQDSVDSATVKVSKLYISI